MNGKGLFTTRLPGWDASEVSVKLPTRLPSFVSLWSAADVGNFTVVSRVTHGADR